jgi:hypothetical protein
MLADQQLINKLQTIAEEGVGEGEDKVTLNVAEVSELLMKATDAMATLSSPLISPQQALKIKAALRV